ncbi:MAG: hypothetical protein ACRD2R_07030 [Terriglobales bacterium]
MNSRTRHFSSIPILFRLQGEEVWELGAVENLSGTGVLFRSRSYLDNETPLELKVIIPGATLGSQPVRLLCRAEVLRSLRASPIGSRVAARFSSFQFEAAVNPLQAVAF